MTECTFANWIEIDGTNDVDRIDIDIGSPGRQVALRVVDFGRDGNFDRASATLPLD